MQFNRAFFLLLASTTFHGERRVSVYCCITSLAREYSTQCSRDFKSIGDNFQRLIGFSMRSLKRRSCSSSLTENQYFTNMMPDLISISSNSGHERRNSVYSSCVQKPITCSTPARLYQDRSNRTISPLPGRCG